MWPFTRKPAATIPDLIRIKGDIALRNMREDALFDEWFSLNKHRMSHNHIAGYIFSTSGAWIKEFREWCEGKHAYPPHTLRSKP